MRIEDYALIGDTHSAALVGKNGSIDWLCLPRFDSGACFAALLGQPEQGHWSIAPSAGGTCACRAYRENTLVLESEFREPGGGARVIDFMPLRADLPRVVRIVEGLRGRVRMRMELVIRFDYGAVVPWVTRTDDGALHAIGGPDALYLRTKVATRGEGLTTIAEFEIAEGERVPFTLSWHASHTALPAAIDPEQALAETAAFWREWCGRCSHRGDFAEPVIRSLITLKALTYAPTGGIVAAPTTSLPEQLGGSRNWDYRFCWLRDATFVLYALMNAGYHEEASAWRDWLLRAVAGDPARLQTLYGPAGERRIHELELPWLSGYQGSRPVRIGNAAVHQRQLDVFGEVMDVLHQAQRVGIETDAASWALETHLLDFLESNWQEPDEGIWEVRGRRRHFTHSKLMAWVAFDRAVRSVEEFGMQGPLERWRALREQIRRELCERAYDPRRKTFTQSYDSQALDASLLMIALVGFLPPDDERVRGTIAAIERELCVDGFVRRYTPDPSLDGQSHGEGAFLACSFWLADNYALLGRTREAETLFERLLGVRNDVGLLAEEYDLEARRLVGNFPQAFSHVALVNTALNLRRSEGPAQQRRK